jgi:hypothetical protein
VKKKKLKKITSSHRKLDYSFKSVLTLMVQILGGLITYLLLAIYCHKNHGERVNIIRVRQLRIQIQNEIRDSGSSPESYFFKEQKQPRLHAKT